MIMGPSGSGKSALALQLIGLGADLVADDRVVLSRSDARLVIKKPESLPAKIEARGVGLLDAPMADQAFLSLVVDLTEIEAERLPEARKKPFLGIPVTIWRYVDALYFPVSILLYLRREAEKLG